MNVINRFFVIALLVFASAKVFAVNPGFRTDLFYDIGYFHQENGQWYETQNGKLAFTFRELNRTDQYIDIYDYTRKLTVRLNETSFSLRFDHESSFKKFKNAQWDLKRMAFFGTPGNHQYFLLSYGNQWRHVSSRPDGGATTVPYREVARGNGIVELRNDNSRTTLRIFGHPKNLSVVRYTDGTPATTILSGGAWSMVE